MNTQTIITLADALRQQAEAQRRFDALKRSLGAERAKRLEQLWQANQVVQELTKKDSK